MNAIATRLAVPEDARAIAIVRVQAWRSTCRGMIPYSYLAGMKVEASGAPCGRWQIDDVPF